MPVYLQDDFFTVRSERYVVPMKLDGRGRVKGSILDTSASGQTLFIEPVIMAPDERPAARARDRGEAWEIARIFRELSAKVEAEVETLTPSPTPNWRSSDGLDGSAEAQLAAELRAGPVRLASDEPTIDLKDARHPLIRKRRLGGKLAPSATTSASRHRARRVLIISGPNAGGKTVVLKTVGLLHLDGEGRPARGAGRRLTARVCTSSSSLWLEMGDAQNLAANLSTFSGHLLGLKPILEKAGGRDLALLDELAVGTDPETGAAIGTAILEDLAARRVTALVTTHFDALKGLAVSDKRFRNGSMEFSLGTLSPTYKLILDLPGQSYGLEVAEQIGLPAQRCMSRARRASCGTAPCRASTSAVTELMAARDESAPRARRRRRRKKVQAEAERVRWQQEVELLKEQRAKASQQLADRYEDKLSGPAKPSTMSS